jgi:hypothetical protein
LTAQRPTCLQQGYSDCGPQEFHRPQGTSFAAAIVSAGAALVRSAWPDLKADQIVAMMRETAVDQTPASGCRRCAEGRDPLTGWGRLDVAAAVTRKGEPPIGDRYEPNDDAGSRAAPVKRRRSVKRRATIDFWDDRHDVYAVQLRRGESLRVRLFGQPTINVDLVLWMPDARRLDDGRHLTGRPARSSEGDGARERVDYRARRAGRYFVHVKISEPASAYYTLRLVRK